MGQGLAAELVIILTGHHRGIVPDVIAMKVEVDPIV
jgi:hypothetical protein